MCKEKQKMHLSELFLEKLKEDFSQKAVFRALEKCNDEMHKRLRQEFMDCWDVCREFNDMFTPEMRKNYLILQMI